MTLAKRLVLGALILIGALGLLVIIVIDQRLYRRFEQEAAAQLVREANLVALLWTPRTVADDLADSTGMRIGHRVTLIAPDGRVLGDSEFNEPALSQLQNFGALPDVDAARTTGQASVRLLGSVAGEEELNAALRTPMGFVRVSVPTSTLATIFNRARLDIVVAVLIAVLGALGLSLLFSRRVSRPIVQLRDVARALADGDLSRRPSLQAPAEVGELAVAIHRLAEQLGARLATLQADEALLAAVVDSLNEGVVVVGRNDRILHINHAGRLLLGIRRTGAGVTSDLPRDRVLRDSLRDALQGNSVDALELTLDGRNLSLTARPLPPDRAVLAVFDLTAVRRLEHVRRDFVANVSHELRTPLTIIGGFAETLGENDVPPEKRKEFADRIQVSAKRMQRVVDELLDLSRIESGGWRPNPTRVDLPEIATDAMAAVHRDAAERGLSVSVDIPTDASEVIADATAVRQIVDNLLQNAVRYTASGFITIFARREAGGVRIGVQDTGVGIAPEHVARIFERFYRVDAGRSRERGGTGLGLAIVKHLVEAHRGSVHAESVVGQGSTISVVLPATPASEIVRV